MNPSLNGNSSIQELVEILRGKDFVKSNPQGLKLANTLSQAFKDQPDVNCSMLFEDDAAVLNRLPGIGPKTFKQIKELFADIETILPKKLALTMDSTIAELGRAMALQAKDYDPSMSEFLRHHTQLLARAGTALENEARQHSFLAGGSQNFQTIRELMDNPAEGERALKRVPGMDSESVKAVSLFLEERGLTSALRRQLP